MMSFKLFLPYIQYVKKYKRFFGIGGFIFVVALYNIFGNSQETTKVITSTYIVKSGSIENSIKVLGNTKITDQQVLTFAQEGTVKALYVKQGQRVKKGDILAEIDKKSLTKDIAQQSLSIQNARINYQKMLNAYTETDKLKAQSSIDDIQVKLDIARKDLKEMASNKGNSLQTNSSKVQSYFLTTKNMVLDAKNILESVDKVFGITNKYKTLNEDISIYISAKNTSARSLTESSYYQANTKLAEVEATLTTLERSSITTIEALQVLQNKSREFLNILSSNLSNSSDAARNSIVSTQLSQSEIDGWVSTFTSASSKTISYLSTVNNDIKGIQTTENDVQSKKSEINNYEAQLAVYKETLQDIINGPSKEDRQLQINSIRQAEISISKLSDQSENYRLVAPFDGNIDVIDLQKGDNIIMDNISEKGITISNPDIYQISMLIDQVDIVKINEGQLAEISFDAYPGYTITGTISGIDPTPTVNAGVVSYSAKINMKKGDKKIYDSMTVTIKILTEKKDNIIIVPMAAIINRGKKSFIQIGNNENNILQEVVLGIKDNMNIEVMSGISLGIKIILQNYLTDNTSKATLPDNNSNENKAADARKSMRGLGIGGGGGGEMHAE